MKRIIEEEKSRNGNEQFTQKEMMWFMINKLNCIDKKIGKKADKKLVYVMFTGLIALLGTILAMGIR